MTKPPDWVVIGFAVNQAQFAICLWLRFRYHPATFRGVLLAPSPEQKGFGIMKIVDSLRLFGAIAAWLVMAAGPPFLQASNPVAKPASANDVAPVIRDVATGSGGKLEGMVINTAGAPVADSMVVIQKAGKQVVTAKTDASGRFVAVGLTGGVYEITSGAGGNVYRLWAPTTAPPAASDGVLIIDSSDVVRGQMSVSEFVTSEVVIIGAVAATAIIIPVAIHNSKRDPAPAS